MDSQIEASPQQQTRQKFTNKLEYLLTALSSAVGLGNVWRFPYLVYRNGGGSFFIPYFLSLIFLGLTFFFFESSIGQYTQLGPIKLWRLSPIFRGIGYAMCMMAIYLGIYYNMLIAWALYYAYASFTALPNVPWSNCNNTWNTANCVNYGEKIHDGRDRVNNNKTLTSPSQEYFSNEVLRMSVGVDHMGSLQPHLVLCLAIAWILIFVGLAWGAKSLGKVSYFTAIFPYVVITALVINGATLEGAGEGVLHYIRPDFSRLGSVDVWSDAATQIFFSLSICMGGVITLASYNPFHNNTIRDSLTIVILNSCTSIFAGFAIFSVIGHMANQIGKEIHEAADQGVGLAFVAYPAALSRLPLPWLWSFIFFLMLIILGFGSQMTIVETIVVNCCEMLPEKWAIGKRRYVLGCVCLVMFGAGLPMCTQAGVYILELMNTYSVPYAAFVIGFFEMVAICWVYGINRHMANVRSMLGFDVWHPLYWRFMFKFGAPSIIVALLALIFTSLPQLKYNEYVFPLYANLVGWTLTVSSVVMIPLFALFELSRVWRGETTYEEILKPNVVFEHECSDAKEKAVQSDIDHDLNGAVKVFTEKYIRKDYDDYY